MIAVLPAAMERKFLVHQQQRWGRLAVYRIDHSCRDFLVQGAMLEYDDMSKQGESWSLGPDVRPFADTTCLLLPVATREHTLPVIIKNAGSEQDFSCFVLLGKQPVNQIMREVVVVAGSVPHMLPFKQGDGVSTDANQTIGMVAFRIFSALRMLNQPRLILKSPMLSPLKRKMAEKAGARGTNNWHRVTWDMSKATREKLDADERTRGVAAHWRRAHWRRAEAHYKGARRRTDAIRPEERDMWWQWIPQCAVGHPTYGFEPPVRQPSMSTGRLAQRSDYPAGALVDA